MPLKLSRRGEYWHLTGTVRGIRVRETTGTADREQAEAYRAKREAEVYDQAVFGARAVVSFARAALSYLEFQERSAGTKAYVKRLVEHFGSRALAKIDQGAADRAVTCIVGDDAAPATKTRSVYVPLTAILNHGHGRGWCAAPKFDRPRSPRGKTRWLSPAEAVALEEGAAPHLRPLLRFLLCTGARLAEALDLEWGDVDLPAARVVFRGTKNGGDRVAALTPAAILALANLPHREGRVFRRDDGEPYVDRGRREGGQIKTAFRTACRRAGLIEHTTPHDCRHSWATWFYSLTKDPLRLKAEGGWKTLSMVERYAHLMPSSMVPEIAKVWGASHPAIGELRRA